MTGVVRSAIRFSWAMALFGVRQATEMLSAFGGARAPRRATGSFDAVSGAAREQLGEDLRGAFRAGDRWQGDLIDTVFGVADTAVDVSRGVASKTVFRGSLMALRQSAAILENAMPIGSGAWRELRNKLEAFDNFQYVDRILGFDGLAEGSLQRQIEKADRPGPYLKLWLTEGLGFAFAEAAWDRGEPRQLLRRPALDRLPVESLIPLHTGMGLSLARHVLPDLEDRDPAAVSAALERFDGLCASNARDGFALASYEALGLIARQLAPASIAEIDHGLARLDEDRHREAFWHGLGRGLYFAATQSLPGSTGRAVDKVRQEAPAGSPQRNALAGLAWAVTLVNFRQPEVVERFLRIRDFSAEENDAIDNGVASAVVLWRDAAGEEALSEAFRSHRPAGGSGSRWQRITGAGRSAMEGDPGEIFHYQRGPAACG